MDPATADDAADQLVDAATIAACLDEEYRLRRLIDTLQRRYEQVVERNRALTD